MEVLLLVPLVVDGRGDARDLILDVARNLLRDQPSEMTDHHERQAGHQEGCGEADGLGQDIPKRVHGRIGRELGGELTPEEQHAGQPDGAGRLREEGCDEGSSRGPPHDLERPSSGRGEPRISASLPSTKSIREALPAAFCHHAHRRARPFPWRRVAGTPGYALAWSVL